MDDNLTIDVADVDGNEHSIDVDDIAGITYDEVFDYTEADIFTIHTLNSGDIEVDINDQDETAMNRIYNYIDCM